MHHNPHVARISPCKSFSPSRAESRTDSQYYIKKGEVERAQQILARLHANGEMNDPLVHFEMREIRAALDQEEMGSRSSYLDFFRTNGNIRRLIAAVTLGLGTNWVGNGLVS